MDAHASAIVVTGITVVALAVQVVAGTIRARWHLRRLMEEHDARSKGD